MELEVDVKESRSFRSNSSVLRVDRVVIVDATMNESRITPSGAQQ